MNIVTGEGQLSIGDKITIVGKSTKDDQKVTVKDVIKVNGCEEIIINKKRNCYFITHMLVAGDSWARQVQITEKAH
jgi:hypothetical protein